MWRAGWAGADGGEAGGQMSRWQESSRARADQWKQAGCPHPISPLQRHLGSAAAAPGEVGDPLRNLTEDEDEEDCLERAPLTAVVVALWRVWRWQWQPAGWSGLWLAVPVPDSVPPCQPAKRPPAEPGEGVAEPPLQPEGG